MKIVIEQLVDNIKNIQQSILDHDEFIRSTTSEMKRLELEHIRSVDWNTNALANYKLGLIKLREELDSYQKAQRTLEEAIYDHK